MSASAEDTDSTVKKRFATLSEAQFNMLITERESSNTRKSTENAVRTFRSYLVEKTQDTGFESWTADKLDTILCKFFTEARTAKGELYKKTTLIGLRHGINRHLSNSDSNYDIVNGANFKKSQVAFKAMLVELKREGKGGIEHHPPLDSGDLIKLYQYFNENRDVPEVLQSKVFVDVMLHFGRRGRENLKDMRIVDFWMKTDSDGHRYIFINRDELTKNHQTDTNTAEGRMFEIKGKLHFYHFVDTNMHISLFINAVILSILSIETLEITADPDQAPKKALKQVSYILWHSNLSKLQIKSMTHTY